MVDLVLGDGVLKEIVSRARGLEVLSPWFLSFHAQLLIQYAMSYSPQPYPAALSQLTMTEI